MGSNFNLNPHVAIFLFCHVSTWMSIITLSTASPHMNVECFHEETMVVPYQNSISTAAAGAAIIAVTSVVILPTLTSSSPLFLITEPDGGGGGGDDGEFECSLRTGTDFTTIMIVQQISCILTYGGSIRDIIINYTLLVMNLVFCVGFVVSVTGRNHSYSQQATTTRPAFPTHSIATTWDLSYRQRCFLALIFLVGFQIGLCLCVGCTGISIIWCAMCGWILKNGSDKRNVQQQGQPAPRTTQEQLLQEQFIANENSETSVENATSDSTNPADGHPVSNLANTVDLSTTIDHYERFEQRFEGTWIGRQRISVICCDILIIVYYAVSSPFITTVAHFCALVLGAVLSTMTAGNNGASNHEVRSSLEIDSSQVIDPSESVSQPLLASIEPPT